MVDPASIKYALIYEHINQEMGVDQIITEQLSIYLTRHLWYIDLEKHHVHQEELWNKVLAVEVFTVCIENVLDLMTLTQS